MEFGSQTLHGGHAMDGSDEFADFVNVGIVGIVGIVVGGGWGVGFFGA